MVDWFNHFSVLKKSIVIMINHIITEFNKVIFAVEPMSGAASSASSSDSSSSIVADEDAWAQTCIGKPIYFNQTVSLYSETHLLSETLY